MRSNYNCILRNTFEIIEGEIPSVININYFADDGFVCGSMEGSRKA